MIEFKITTCPDRSQQSTYQHVGRELVIGRTEGEMLIDDPSLGPAQLRVTVQADRQATLESLHPSVETRLNGKPIGGPAPLKEKDNVTAGRTTIHFLRLDLAALQPPEPFAHPNAEERFAPGTREQAVLEALEILEKRAGGATPPKPPPLPRPVVPPPLPNRKP